jgi:hypothetical protein
MSACPPRAIVAASLTPSCAALAISRGNGVVVPPVMSQQRSAVARPGARTSARRSRTPAEAPGRARHRRRRGAAGHDVGEQAAGGTPDRGRLGRQPLGHGAEVVGDVGPMTSRQTSAGVSSVALSRSICSASCSPSVATSGQDRNCGPGPYVGSCRGACRRRPWGPPPPPGSVGPVQRGPRVGRSARPDPAPRGRLPKSVCRRAGAITVRPEPP